MHRDFLLYFYVFLYFSVTVYDSKVEEEINAANEVTAVYDNDNDLNIRAQEDEPLSPTETDDDYDDTGDDTNVSQIRNKSSGGK